MGQGAGVGSQAALHGATQLALAVNHLLRQGERGVPIRKRRQSKNRQQN